MKSILSHLNNEYTLPVRDPLWKNIYLSAPLKELISDASFQRLGRIKQLGPAFHVYPGAVHTRLNHSLGVFHLAGRIMKSLLNQRNIDFLTLEGMKAFLCAALFHDLGHFPFAHSLKELPLKDHEILSSEIILSPPLSLSIKKNLKVDPFFVAAIINESLHDRGNPEIQFYRKILSGVLDPDKLDYLNRDAYFCGVPYGMQDAEFIIHKLSLYGNKPALEQSGLLAVENLLFSKYMMYKAVYWHKSVRIATGMIKKAIYMALHDKVITDSQLYNIDDEQFFQILSKKEYPPFVLIDMVLNRNFFKSILEIKFDPENPEHHRLLNLEYRFEKSVEIPSKLSGKFHSSVLPETVIIDIPEPISFEVDMTLLDGDSTVNFTESDSVFSTAVVKGFTESLRKIRIFIPQHLIEKADTLGNMLL